MNCNGGNIGGGDATGTGDGGDAAINVSGGTLDCKSIGGGNSVTGAPGAVTNTNSDQSAGVIVTGGTLKAGTIGGGTNTNGAIGFATVDISGGDIQGQFILSNTDDAKQCFFTMTGGTIDNTALWSATENSQYQMTRKNGGAVYLSDLNGIVNISGGTIQNCKAELGGAVYMTAGTFELSGTGIIYDCTATKGGAVYLEDGTVNISGGSLGTIIDNVTHPNKAENGAGVYMNGGSLTVSGGQIGYNSAENGAGAYLANGKLTISGGQINANTASENGGGFYLAGGQLYITDGTIQSNTAQNGAGAYVADSTVRMFGGSFKGNTASENGGGIYVSSENQAADVVIRSGNLRNNRAGDSNSTSVQGNGGAIAVVSSSSDNKDQVIIGLRETHPNLDTSTRKFKEFDYTDDKDDSVSHHHADCPHIEDNQASGNGGGIYMSSSGSILDIYCLYENKNSAAADETGGSIMSEGGRVNIGDIGNDGKGNNTASAKGNVFIQSPMLIKGGEVNLYGNTENPQFEEKILVDIQENAGSFHDYRFTKMTDNVNYKIEYFENFNNSGAYTSMQYDAEEDIIAMGNMYTHEGYTIVGWAIKSDANEPDYTTGSLIGSKENHQAWDGKGNTEALKLYAVWKKVTYTVKYLLNAPNGTEYTGTMSDGVFTYGETKALAPNAFKVFGKRFVRWNTEADGSGISYPADYNESKMSTIQGSTIPLYAQWVDCTHKDGEYPGTLSYTIDNTTHTITENCDCGGHTASVSISGASVYYYDGSTHPAVLKYTNTLLTGNPQITYLYKADSSGTYGDMPEETTEPVKEGYYQASITVGGETTFIEYEIQSPANAATINVTAGKGQHFDSFAGQKSCTAAQDDAFTVQYNVQSLNAGINTDSDADENEGTSTSLSKAYRIAPVLTLSQALPAGTTIIMQTAESYWYNSQPSGKEIELNSFIKMGGNSMETFSYNTDNISDTQMYRFIVDFSGVDKANYLNMNNDLKMGLKYAYTNPTTGEFEADSDKEEQATITISSEAEFNIVVDSTSNECTVTAPSDVANTRWARKNLVWKIAPADNSVKIPSDAKLLSTSTVNGEYSLNKNGEFIVPFTWTGSQDFSFTLNSQQESISGQSYELTAVLCVGSQISGNTQPTAVEDHLQKASQPITLTVPVVTKPALKISGRERVLSSTDNLNITIDYQNVDGYNITAVIQKEIDGEYKGEYYKGSINQTGDYALTLKSTNGPGKYRVWVTVATSTQQTVMEVPYYFIVQ